MIKEIKDEELKYWVAFAQIEWMGPASFKRLINHFPNLKQAWQASFSELKSIGLPKKTFAQIAEQRSQINPDQELGNLKNKRINVVTIKDDAYPFRLKQIYDPPAVLFYLGKLPAAEKSLTVVGTRKFSPYGRQIIEHLVPAVASQHVSILSGLAFGIDTLAHRACLDAHGRTVAVIGSGLDLIHPASNNGLAREIVDQGGAIVSEFPLGRSAQKWHFPLRNRILAGISQAVLVIEAPPKSGALITSQLALDYGHEVMAVPGSIFVDGCQGTNTLISKGATPIHNSEEILNTLGLENSIEPNKAMTESLSQGSQSVLKLLSREPVHIDRLAADLAQPIQKISVIISELQIQGIIKNIGGGYYVLV